MTQTTIDKIREVVRDCIEQDAVHGSAIHWDLGKDSDGNDRFYVTWGKSGEYTLVGVENNIGIENAFVYTVHDYDTGESMRFFADHIESDPKRWDDGEPDFASEGLSTLATELIMMIDTPEYDLYGKIFERREDGSYYLTEEAAAEQKRREEERLLRNSRPECMPTNAAIGMQLLTHLISQGALSAKHLLPPKAGEGTK